MGRKRWIAAAAFSLTASVAAVSGGFVAKAGASGPYSCSGGTAAAPQTIPPGTYTTLSVTGSGTCAVDAGAVTVVGDVSVAPGGALVDAFEHAPLTVTGNVSVATGALAILGCEPNFFTCFDAPSNGSGSSSIAIKGSLLAQGALTVVTHVLSVTHDVRFLSGGGSVSCPNEGPASGTVPGNTPAAKFLDTNGIPPYFDNEDNNIGGNVWITGNRTCWIGSLRNHVAGSFVDENNTMADPDAGEVLANHVGGNLLCTGNSPATQFGDSGSSSNVVGGTALGQCAFGVKKPNLALHGSPMQPIAVQDPNPQGYQLGGGDGGVFAFGTAFYGSAPGTNEIFNYSGIADSPGGHGYWIVNGSGHIAGFGPNAAALGDPQALLPNAPMVGLAASPLGDGYYIAGTDGGVYNYGPGTAFYGSAGSLHLARPITGVAAAAWGTGYYLTAGDGGVFNYGPGAPFHGSLGGMHLNAPIVGMAVDPVTGGYWLVGSDGGVFAFDAPFFGSLGAMPLNQPVVGIVAAPGGNGYYLVARDGGVFALGPGTHFQGSTGAMTLNQPIDGMALG